MKSHCSVCRVHVHQAQLWVEVASKEIEITHIAIDIVHLVCSHRIKKYLLVRHNTRPLAIQQGTRVPI